MVAYARRLNALWRWVSGGAGSVMVALCYWGVAAQVSMVARCFWEMQAVKRIVLWVAGGAGLRMVVGAVLLGTGSAGFHGGAVLLGNLIAGG